MPVRSAFTHPSRAVRDVPLSELRERSRRSRGGITNALLLFSILLVSAVYHSYLGGPGSIYNSVNVGLIGLFLLLNREFKHDLVVAFALPLMFLAMSIVGNLGTVTVGGFRAAGAIAVGYALFMLRPVLLHQILLRRLVTIYLIGALALSVFIFTQNPTPGFGSANANFNVNPNGASVFFVGSAMLSLAVVRRRLGWMLAIPFMLLTVTTGSRAGAVVIALILLGHSMFSQDGGPQRSARALLRQITSKWRLAAMAALVVALAMWFIPDAVEYLLARFQVGQSRSEQWDEAWGSIRTMRGLLIGGGPATLGVTAGFAAHNSYIEAIGNSGLFFLITTLFALLSWLRRSVRNGHRDLLWIAPPVLVYGLVENILFNGIGTLWLLLMLLAVVMQSRPSAASAARHAEVRGPSPARRVPVRRLVIPEMTRASSTPDQ